ncbi:MAP kinase-activated protein kinase 2 (Fragment) [Seminavis robusta]|uniref:MAP kinase-activated protein kinase 2 n=1 Tax=Seminavis robusta TaxID=568900 RepID=A0A9N8DSF6_9STRA
MFGSKFASTLTRAVAARSSTEMTAAAAAVAIAATVAVTGSTETETPQQQQQQPDVSSTKQPLLLRPRLLPLPVLTTTSCEALMPQQHATGHRFSRLARRRTLQRMKKTQTRETLESKYMVDPNPLGDGAFGEVLLARHRKTGEGVAVKKIPKQFTSDMNFQCEMDALMHIRAQGGHPNICALRENFEEGEYYYLVLDLVGGGEMFDHLCANGAYSEADAARLVREVASALAFCHGIGLVHGDLKPENLMLSSENPLHAVIKIVDFGCAQVTKGDQERMEGQDAPTAAEQSIVHGDNTIANTPAYCPPEILDVELRKKRGLALYNKIDPSFDMWALGVILYIMLTGVHPFDLDGTATDDEVEQKIVSRQAPPLRNSPLTAHLSDSAISLIEQLMQWEPEARLTAHQMLEHPWVMGETALTGKMANSDKKLSSYRAYKSRLEAKVFSDMVQWSNDMSQTSQAANTSLLERAFHNLDESKRGYITKKDLRRLSGRKDNHEPPTKARAQATSAATLPVEEEALDLSGFSELLADNLKNRYFPKGHVVYREGDRGDQMFFINSGTIQVSSSDGHASTRTQGDTFGEGALLHDSGCNTSTIKCVTPVHAIEISRNYFEKFLEGTNGDETNVAKIHLFEKDATRKRERASRLLRNQSKHEMKEVKAGERLYDVGDIGQSLFILEEGKADVVVGNGKLVFTLDPGEMCGDYAIAFGRPRNTSTICTSAGGCKFRVMNKAEYQQVVSEGPWWVKKSLRDISLRREFQKALVMKTGQAFPTTDEAQMKRLFEIADVNKSGKLELDNVREMLHAFDKSFSDADVKEILDALDLDDSGAVSFDEFKRMFTARPKTVCTSA